MQTLAQLREWVRPNFVTLTVSDPWTGHSNPKAWREAQRRFEERFRRAFPEGCLIWRRDTIDRKSGERKGKLSPHWHLLVFGVEFNRLRSWVPVQWFESVGSNDPEHLAAGTQVARVHSRNGIMSYASKAVGVTMSREMGKQIQSETDSLEGEHVSLGRWWGIVGVENFYKFLSDVKEYILEETEAVTLIRYFRKMAKIKGRDCPSLFAFINGKWLLQYFSKLAIPMTGKKSYRSTGRPYDKSFSEWLILRC